MFFCCLLSLMTKSDDRVTEWEEGLPSPEELTPLSQSLISPELASAFSIAQESFRTPADVQRASQSVFASLRRTSSAPIASFKGAVSLQPDQQNSTGTAFAHGADGQVGGSGDGRDGADQNISLFPQPFQPQGTPGAGFPPSSGQLGSSPTYGQGAIPAVLNGLPYASSPAYERRPDISSSPIACGAGTDSSDGAARKPRKPNEGDAEEAESGTLPENSNEEQAARTLKRPRLVWTPQLHKRFVDAVAHLGIKHAVPKTIMQLMNVEGLTRENVASHLQKYRLYLKRMQGLSNEGPSASDQLFASTPVPPSLAASAHFLAGHRDDVVPIPFPGSVVPVPIGLSHGSIPAHMNAAGPFPGFDPRAYSALARTLPPRLVPGDQRDIVGDNQNQSGSPPRPILTLFPSGH